MESTSEDRSHHLHIRAEPPLFLTLFLSEIEEKNKVYNSYDVIWTMLCYYSLSYGQGPTSPQH